MARPPGDDLFIWEDWINQQIPDVNAGKTLYPCYSLQFNLYNGLFYLALAIEKLQADVDILKSILVTLSSRRGT